MCHECTLELINQIEYNTEWLDSVYLSGDFMMSTNREIVTGQVEMPDDFIDPYKNPKQLDAMRKLAGMSAYGWREYVEVNYPGIDSKKQYQLAKEDAKEHRRSRCGTLIYRKSLTKVGATEVEPWMCKDWKGCPICREHMTEKLRGQYGKTWQETKAYKVNWEQLKEIQSSRTKNDYDLIPIDSETSYIILRQDDKVDLPETNDTLTQIINASIDCSGRKRSGKLSSQKTAPVKKQEQKEETILELNSPEECSRRVYELEFTDDSTVKDSKEIDKIVLREFEFDKNAERTIDFLQDTIYRLEQKTQEVAERHCVKIHFLYVENKSVYIEKVDWSLLEKYTV